MATHHSLAHDTDRIRKLRQKHIPLREVNSAIRILRMLLNQHAEGATGFFCFSTSPGLIAIPKLQLSQEQAIFGVPIERVANQFFDIIEFSILSQDMQQLNTFRAGLGSVPHKMAQMNCPKIVLLRWRQFGRILHQKPMSWQVSGFLNRSN